MVRSNKKIASPFVLDVKEKVSVKDIREGNIQNHLKKLTEFLALKFQNEKVNDSLDAVLNVSVRFAKGPSSVSHEPEKINKKEDKEVVKGLEYALQEHLKKKAEILKKLPKKFKEFEKFAAENQKGKKSIQLETSDSENKSEKHNENGKNSDLIVNTNKPKKQKKSNNTSSEKTTRNESDKKGNHTPEKNIKKNKKQKHKLDDASIPNNQNTKKIKLNTNVTNEGTVKRNKNKRKK